MGKALGKFRAVYLAALCCTGSFLFAYDTGAVGGVLTLASFQHDFDINAKNKATVSANATSLLQAGVANTGSLVAFYVARVISGIGVGMATVIIPMYSAEMAPKEIRGQLGSMFQFFFTLGVMTSYWVDYGVTFHVPAISRQWQIPIGLQLVPGGVLGLGMVLTKESTRWLAKRGKHEQGMESLIWVRGGDSSEVQEEYAEIVAGIREEELATEGLTWKECLLPVNRFRLILVIALQIGVQLTGNTSLAYFAPQIFQAVGAGDQALLISGFFGLVKVVACLFFLLFLVERIGRRGSLLTGAFLMGSFMFIVALLTATHPPKPNQSLTSTGAAAVAIVYLEAMAYNMSWGPVPWLYQSEIFPSRIREVGVAAGTATQWLFNFAFTQITPRAINNIGWKTFLIFAILNWALVIYAWFVIKETKGKSLEEMEALFGSSETAIDIEKVHDQVNQRDDAPTGATTK
ncbi:putative MFS sugar transporter [Xylariaceae sp. FL1651]|nr:putative MFS sugar transporter [Xylariaceae sp. FL1651]